MKTRWKILVLFVAILLFARIPLQQGDFKGGEEYDHFGYDDGYGLLQIGSSMEKNNYNLNPEESYAISPDGNRLKIETEPHPFDLENNFPKHPYVRDRVYLIKPNGERYESLSSGNWEFHFTLNDPEGKINRVFKGERWTFYYSPIWHGSPL
ncbi:MAG: hypothetical protein OEY66_07350 [Gammaproteobacteria bacterium]|nr:hypothetical protein [Gammaproteobacteria bacterium]